MGTYCSLFGFDRRERQPKFTVDAGCLLHFQKRNYSFTQVFQVAEPAFYAKKSHLPCLTQPLNVHPNTPPDPLTNI